MLRWMMDENGRPQSVTSQQYQDMLQQCIGRKSKINGAVGVTGLCKMEQSLTQATSTSTFPLTNFKKEWSPLGHKWPPYTVGPLQSGSEPSFHSFVWIYVKYKISCIKHELIPKPQLVVEDVAVTIPMDMLGMQFRICARAPRRSWRRLEAILSILSDLSKKRRL